MELRDWIKRLIHGDHNEVGKFDIKANQLSGKIKRFCMEKKESLQEKNANREDEVIIETPAKFRVTLNSERWQQIKDGTIDTERASLLERFIIAEKRRGNLKEIRDNKPKVMVGKVNRER